MTSRCAALHGTGRLVHVILRRDRLRLVLWLVFLGGVIVVSAASLPPLYPDQQSIDNYARLFGDNPALVALAGPGYGFDDPNLGVILVNETQLWGMIGMALMALLLTVRHTRAEEDVERAELVRSSVVGRHAPTAAAIVVVAGAVLILAAGCGVGFVALGYDTVGSVALAGSLAAVGLVFTGLAVVTDQVVATARTALIVGILTLVAAFLARALGDIADSPLRWTSPIGWAQSVRAFAHESWWPLGLCVAVTVLFVVGAFALANRRDLGSGIIAPRRGSPVGRRLDRPWRLAWRLHRATMVFWALGMVISGAVYASVADDVDDLVAENPALADLLAQLQGATLVDAFFATSLALLAAVSTGALVGAVMRMRTEESAGRVEALWATPVSRWRWAAGHLVIIVVGTTGVLAASGVGLGLTYAVIIDEPGQVPRLTVASLAMLPGVLSIGSVGVVLLGWWPRASMASWVVLGVVVIIDVFGELLRLPNWLRSVSPFWHLPAVPAQAMTWTPFGAVALVAAMLMVFGLVGLRRRDLQPS